MSIDARCYGAKTDPNEWILDSAATRHMTYSKESLVNYCPISAAVEVGGKHELHVMGIGDKRVTLKTDHGTRQVWLRNVYYVPSIQFNLFSVRMQVAMRGADYIAVHFDHPAFATVIDENGGIAHANLAPESKLYTMRLESIQAEWPTVICAAAIADEKSDMRLWHKRLGHPGRNSFDVVMRGSMEQLGVKKFKALDRTECEA